MRLVVFTGNADIEASPWWEVIGATPGLSRVLVVIKRSSNRPSDVLRRLHLNIRKHGWVFVPYRIVVLAIAILRRALVRGRWDAPSSSSLPVDRFESLDIHAPETLEHVRDWKPDLGISLGAPILKPSLFRIPARGTINLHSGKVPDFRGAPPAFWELWTGAREIGATVHWMDEGLDTGAVISQATAPIYEHDTLAAVEARVEELGRVVLRDALFRLAAGHVPGTPQPRGGTTYRFPTLTTRWRLSARLAWRSASRLFRRPAMAAKVAAGLLVLGLLRPLRDLWRSATRRHPVRVFTFHRVTDLTRDGMTSSRSLFRRQVRYIGRHHDVVPLSRAIALLRAKARLRRPVAAITFDDGYRSVFLEARPVLKEHAMVGCCFVCTDLVGTEGRYRHDEDNPVRPFLGVMDWEDLAELQRDGWELGGHTASHSRLSSIRGAELLRELSEPLAALRGRLGLSDVTMAYPFGGRDDISPEAQVAVRSCGYWACFSDFGGENVADGESWDLLRIDVGGDHDTIGWKTMVHGIPLAKFKGPARAS